MSTWYSEAPPDPVRIDGAGWLRLVLRGTVLILLILVCLFLLLVVRLVERPIFGLHRPWTPFIVQFVCRNAFRILGMTHRLRGEVMKGPGAVVANHSSWLDIFALNARKRVYFVSKAEVSRWPGIGFLAQVTGTLFIERDRRKAREQTNLLAERLKAGQKLLFFPEGTSTDGLRVLPFKTTLFAAFFSDTLHDSLWVQPVSVVYHAAQGEPSRFYAWWGDMDFGPHLMKILAARKQGSVEVIYHHPVRVADYNDRKALASAMEEQVRDGHTRHLAQDE
ncbi:lysophospholipid acyltransferase family protein [Lutimaribacter marinistellae]|uniref:Lysophospholipid acyltransferase family protein n=1 Tax=Lutimaribacter marinistellae TaxID=1820329 RepID=A0ABV7TNQ3_9RHOB